MIARPLKKARSVNATTSAFPSSTDTLTEPVGDDGTATGRCVIDVGTKGHGTVPRFMEIFPYASAAANDTFSLRIIGWQRIMPPLSDGRIQWIPYTIAEFACTVGAETGVAGGAVVATELYVDTITVVSEEVQASSRGRSAVFSPANDTKARLVIDLEGVEKVELVFDQTLNTPAMNALYRFYDRFDDEC